MMTMPGQCVLYELFSYQVYVLVGAVGEERTGGMDILCRVGGSTRCRVTAYVQCVPTAPLLLAVHARMPLVEEGGLIRHQSTIRALAWQAPRHPCHCGVFPTYFVCFLFSLDLEYALGCVNWFLRLSVHVVVTNCCNTTSRTPGCTCCIVAAHTIGAENATHRLYDALLYMELSHCL